MPSTKFAVVAHAVIVLLLATIVPSWGFSENQVRQLQNAVSELNKTLPAMTSREMQLTMVQLRGDNEFVYMCKTTVYSVNQINPRLLESNLKPAAANYICTTPGTKEFAKQGIKFTYVFYDKDNRYISEYSITGRDCR